VRVVHLSLSDFRNYERAEIDLEPGQNLFVGFNGQGKTNLVESLSYLSVLGSHRVSHDSALIRQGTDSAVVRALLAYRGREVLVEVQINRNAANRAQINRSVARPRDLPKFFSSVLFAPEDLALVRGGPASRRRFADELLVLYRPRLSSVLADYDRVVRQRNTLLKSLRAARHKDVSLDVLDVWDERLVAFGSQIIDARLSLVDELSGPLADAYFAIVGDDHAPVVRVHLSVDSNDPESLDDVLSSSNGAELVPPADEPTESRFATALERIRPREIDRGVTLIGPHRDDFVFSLNDLPAKGYASHGESWSFVLALRLASAELLRKSSSSGDPVLILDDVFAELDEVRRSRLATAIQDYEQVLVTAAVIEDVPLLSPARVVQIVGGTVGEGNHE
jgi:DNA replication and repair protein RecF